MRAALLFVVLTLPVPGLGAQVEFETTVCFGDSLTHNNLLGLVSGIPQNVYGVDPMEAAFLKGHHPGDELTSYAVGGSESDELVLQAAAYAFNVFVGNQTPATLVNVQIGANDIRNNRSLLANNPVGTDPAADAVIDDVIADLDLVLLSLDDGSRQFIVWTVPDVLDTPDHWKEFNVRQSTNLREHTARINKFISHLTTSPNFAIFDINHTLDAFVHDPPTLDGNSLIGPPVWGDYDHLFGDDIHPSGVTNALFANGIISAACQRFGGYFFGYSEAELAALAHF